MMRSFQFDHTLPPLPIPALSDTCQNLRQVIRPLVDRDTWEQTLRLLDDFEGGSAGPRLQQLLMDWRDSRGGNSSWLRPFWDDMYLSFRERLPVNMNYGLELTERRGKDALPLLVYGLCRALTELRCETLPPEPLKDGYLSMDMLRNMIYTRIPHYGRDTLYYPSLSGPMTAAVVCQGHWFILSLQYEDGSFLTPSAIKKALALIEAQGKALEPAAGISAFTSAPREQAAALRAELQHSLLNRTSLESIEKAAFSICLEQDPADQSGFNTSLICGDAANRWFDKSLQIISTTGGYLGVNIEHAGCDASIWVYLFNRANSIVSSQEIPIPPSSPSPAFRMLSWQTGGGFAAKLSAMRREFRAVTRDVTLCSRHITSISREVIKAKKCGPDAFVQLLFQAAYYQLTRRFQSVYEAVSTRSFYQGRTECVRSCTEESVAFVTAFVDRTAPAAKLRERFYLAEQAHAQGIRRGQKALGPERHMTGLLSMYKMADGVINPPLEKPEIFDSEGYRTLCHTVLSTSSITAPFIGQFCFGPVVQDGIGIGYGLTPDALNLSVSAYSASGIDPSTFVNIFEELSEKLLGILS